VIRHLDTGQQAAFVIVWYNIGGNICGAEVELVKLLSLKKRDTAMKSALFNARMEGFHVPESIVRESRKILDGKLTADELIRQYTVRYTKR